MAWKAIMVNYDCKKRTNVIVNEEYAGGPTLGHRQCPPSSQVSLQVALLRQMTPGFSCAPQRPPFLKRGRMKYLCGGGARPYFRVCPDLAGTRSGAGVTWVSDIPGRLDSSFGKRGPQRPPEPANHSPKRQTPAETVVTEDQCASTRRISTGCSSAYIHPWADAPGLRPHGKCQKFLLH